MRLPLGLAALLTVLSGGSTLWAQCYCDICICPRVMVDYDPGSDPPETAVSLWQCQQHECPGDCECSTWTTVLRYYGGEQFEGDCSWDCQVYCEQIVLGPIPIPARPAVPAAPATPAGSGTPAKPATPATPAEPPTTRAKHDPAPPTPRSFRMNDVANPNDDDLENYGFKYNDEDGWNKHIVEATVDPASICYLKVDRKVGSAKSTLKLLTVKLKIKDAKTGEFKYQDMRIGYEVQPSMGTPACSGTVHYVGEIKASEEGYSDAKTQKIDGYYMITIGPSHTLYRVRTKHDLKPKP